MHPIAVIDKSRDVAMDMERKGKAKNLECHGQFEYNEQLEVENVQSDEQYEMNSSEYDRQIDMGDNEYARHEMVLESSEHDRQLEMRGSQCDEETKQSNDELHEGEALIAMCNVNECRCYCQ